MALGRAICAIQRLWDTSNAASYSHAGIILGPIGTTYEAVWTNKRQSLFTAYKGIQVLIGRHRLMNADRFKLGWKAVEHLEGRWYAGHRLFLMLIPPLAKYLATGKFAVCSELAAKFLKGAGCMIYWSGVTPDYLADLILDHHEWEVVFEGLLPPADELLNLPANVRR
jgi:hypothetical protein